jgi:hypothetical protein
MPTSTPTTKRGRPPVGTPDNPPGDLELTLRRSDIEYLERINPKNLSAAIRALIDRQSKD